MYIRKILSLMLAVAMFTTVAFAVISIEFPGDWLPNGEVEFDAAMLGLSGELNTKNYSLSKLKFDKGKNLVESVELSEDEDEDSLKIILKTDFTLDKPKPLSLSFDIKGKGDFRGEKMTFNFPGENEYINVNYGLAEVWINPDNEVEPIDEPWYDGDLVGRTAKMSGDWTIEGETDFICKFVSDFSRRDKEERPNRPAARSYALTDDQIYGENGAPYGDLEFSTDDDNTDVSVRVYDGDKAFLGYNYDVDKEILLANADLEADISALTFDARPSFNSTATVYFYQVDEDGVVYDNLGGGKIAKSKAVWSEGDGCWVLKTRTLGSYIFSDKALTSVEKDSDKSENPETGRPAIPGMALAVVGLVSLGALTLRKK